ncbi:hypothetical protein EXVG_00473 [Emiliania huxleyi virus 202]|nr:hypothetical protein EXVG_00473 [Emiliania huxleyi virus 202]AHA54382.1 hypothetical protein EhV18_00336 [Emiliania huxleyi virus 18]AHA55422.1 hypothetical protein EhV156_00327 [Emiliania huxleyi virus 156]
MAFVDNTFSFDEFGFDEIDETPPSPVFDETPSSPVFDETPIVAPEPPPPVVTSEPPSPVVDETPVTETTETEIDDIDMTDLANSLANKVSSDEIDPAITDAIKLLRALRKKQTLMKKAKKANSPGVRTQYGSGIPTAAQLFAKHNRAEANRWYDYGGRIPDFNPTKPRQISKHLANMWKCATSAVRAEFEDMRNGIIAQKEEAIAAAVGVPIAM